MSLAEHISLFALCLVWAGIGFWLGYKQGRDAGWNEGREYQIGISNRRGGCRK